jgi:hypothetical protein
MTAERSRQLTADLLTAGAPAPRPGIDNQML